SGGVLRAPRRETGGRRPRRARHRSSLAEREGGRWRDERLRGRDRRGRMRSMRIPRRAERFWLEEPEELATANGELELRSPEERLRFAVDTFGDGLLFTSSFGAESGVLLHLWSRVARHLPVVFIDTGFLFPETLRYRDL